MGNTQDYIFVITKRVSNVKNCENTGYTCVDPAILKEKRILP